MEWNLLTILTIVGCALQIVGLAIAVYSLVGKGPDRR